MRDRSRREWLRAATATSIGSTLLVGASSSSQGEIRSSAGTGPTGILRVTDHLSPEQLHAVRAGKPTEGLADTIERLCDLAGANGGGVLLMPGSYDLRRMIRLHPRCWLMGETPSASPRPDYNPGFGREVGAVLVKNHNDDAVISVRGDRDYATSAGIVGIALSGDASRPSASKGHGLVVDRVGGYLIAAVEIFSIPGDGIRLGTSPHDVTGQIIIDDLYVNNVGQCAIRNRSKWLKASRIASDGGLYGYYSEDSANADVTQFHFEGAAKAAISMQGANGNSRFRGGFIGMTNSAAKTAVILASVPGNVDISFCDIQLNGGDGLETGFEIGVSAWRTSILDCEITAGVGVRDRGQGTRIASKFLNTTLPIEAHGEASDYRGCHFIGTTGPSGIDHYSGSGGLWTEIRTDRPFRSRGDGAPGAFGGNHVACNPGFRTGFRDLATGTSPLRIAHGMALPPTTVLVTEMGGRTGAAAFALNSDKNWITIIWSGNDRRSFAVDARAACEIL